MFRAFEGVAETSPKRPSRRNLQVDPVTTALFGVSSRAISVMRLAAALRKTRPAVVTRVHSARIDKNQVNVRAVVEFAAARGFCRERSRRTPAPAGSPISSAEFAADGLPCGIHDSIGEIGEILGGFRYVGELHDIAQQYAQ